VTTGDEVAGAGKGYIGIYDVNGSKLGQLDPDGALNAPWGLALAPGDFGDLSGDFLVGNFGDGAINAYDPTTGARVGQVKDAFGNPLLIDGLWGLTFGNGGNGGLPNILYFAAGPNDEENGLFGAIQVAPEPGAFATLLLGTLSAAGLLLRRRKS